MIASKSATASISRATWLILATLLLAACAGEQPKPSSTASSNEPARSARKPWKPLGPYTPGGLYAPGVSDGAPDVPPDVANLPEPVPHSEPLSHYGNRTPYVVLGKTYNVLPSANGYVERGMASWYGTKFDGRVTSSFEPYDLSQFTAAHKTLPLPSYARVTNLENGRSVIVRINDRGPFHEGRLIDLSYAAAIKLGVNVHGTAMVEVRGIDTSHMPAPATTELAASRPAAPPPVAAAPKPVMARPPAPIAPMPQIPATALVGMADAAPLDLTNDQGHETASKADSAVPVVGDRQTPGDSSKDEGSSADDTAGKSEAPSYVPTQAATTRAANDAIAPAPVAPLPDSSPVSQAVMPVPAIVPKPVPAAPQVAPTLSPSVALMTNLATPLVPPSAASIAPIANLFPASPAPGNAPVTAAEPAPLPPATGRPAMDPATRGFLQIASYGDRGNAERMLERLEQAGVEHVEVVSVQVADQTLWRVHMDRCARMKPSMSPCTWTRWDLVHRRFSRNEGLNPHDDAARRSRASGIVQRVGSIHATTIKLASFRPVERPSSSLSEQPPHMRLRRNLFTVVSALLAAGSIATASIAAPQPQPHPAAPQPHAAASQPQPAASPTPASASSPSESVAIPPAPTNDGKAWILMDYDTGQVLASNNPDMRIEPASITKVMTSYVVAAELAHGKIDPNQPVAISQRAWKEGGAGTDGSFSAFDLNSKVPLMDVQRGLIIQSGNDAALALAEHVAGSVESFVALMNSYAAKLGMKNTHYMNPHGLSDPQHYTTVHDIAILSRALIHDYPQEYAIYKEREYTYNNIRQYNRNELLSRDPTVDGIKTGHTSAAGFCLAASAKRGDQRLISVVVGIDAKGDKEGFRLREDSNLALLNWGFRFYETHPLYQANVQLAHLKIWKGKATDLALGLSDPIEVVIPRGRYGDLKPVMDVPKQLVAPIVKGQRIGTLRVTLDGKSVIERPLVALADIPQAGFFGRMWDGAWMWWDS